MKKKNLLIIIIALAIVVAVSGRWETVGNSEIAARTSIFGPISTYGPGDKVFVLPGVYKLLRFKAEAVNIDLSGDAAIMIGTGATRKTVECQIAYTLSDPAALIKKFGITPPGGEIKTEIKKIISSELYAAAKTDKDFMGTIPSRVLLTARLLDTLSQRLNPVGIKPQSLNLRLRKDAKKPA